MMSEVIQFSDLVLERDIKRACNDLCQSRTVQGKRTAFKEMRKLIQRRSPEMVRKLEKEKGLS